MSLTDIRLTLECVTGLLQESNGCTHKLN